jgi:cytochrome c553
VARHVGRMAIACGQCHEATAGGPRFVVTAGPAQGSPTAQQMIFHLWAADRMWEGLVGPSEKSWVAGAEALRDAWDTSPLLLPASSTADGQALPVAEMRRLAQEALSATPAEARATVYGKVLTTCKGCHDARGRMAER